MSKFDEALQDIEITIKQAKEKVELADALITLKQSPAFKKVFLDLYLRDFATQMVLRKASMGMQNEDHQKYINNQIDAIGNVNQFMIHIMVEADQAQKAIHDAEVEKDSMFREEE